MHTWRLDLQFACGRGHRPRLGHAVAHALALAYGNPHYRTIKTILEKALDPQRSELGRPSIATVGAYLRGPDALFTVSNSNEEVSV